MATIEINLKGDRELDRELRLIAAVDGEKSVNKVCRDIARDAAKHIVLPAALAAVPFESGDLEGQIRVKQIARSRAKVGSTIGLADPLFTGDQFYGGMIEFGFTHYLTGEEVPADSFLRRALYGNERAVEGKFRNDIRRWVRRRNSIDRL